MRARRILWFFVMIGLGTLLGLVYGWMIQPLRQVNAVPADLRYDYSADVVLMAAEIYRVDGDLEQAARRIQPLGDQPPAQIAAEALESARSLQFPAEDLETLTLLSDALKNKPAGGALP